MSVDLGATYVITAPSGIDGYGARAVLNDSTDSDFVGYLSDLAFALEVRESAQDRVQAHGGVHGSFFHGRLPFTMEVWLARSTSVALSNARANKLRAALNAMGSDGKIVWTEGGRAQTRILFREQQSPRGPDSGSKVVFGGVAADRLILAETATTPAAPTSGMTNSGLAATFPTFTLTSGASGSIVLSRTSPSPTEALTLTIGGTNGVPASTALTVDFAAKTVTRNSDGATYPGAATFPASTWWAMAPGSNTITSSGASSVLVSWRHAWLP